MSCFSEKDMYGAADRNERVIKLLFKDDLNSEDMRGSCSILVKVCEGEKNYHITFLCIGSDENNPLSSDSSGGSGQADIEDLGDCTKYSVVLGKKNMVNKNMVECLLKSDKDLMRMEGAEETTLQCVRAQIIMAIVE